MAPRSDTFDEFLGVHCTPRLQKRVYEAAERDGRTAASWMRQAFRERMERQEGFDPEQVEVDEAEKATAP